MARRGTWSVLRRKGSQAGGLALLCAVLVLPAQAATPSPDPPPLAVAPEPPQARRAAARNSALTRATGARVVAPSPVVRPQAGAVVPAATTVGEAEAVGAPAGEAEAACSASGSQARRGAASATGSPARSARRVRSCRGRARSRPARRRRRDARLRRAWRRRHAGCGAAPARGGVVRLALCVAIGLCAPWLPRLRARTTPSPTRYSAPPGRTAGTGATSRSSGGTATQATSHLRRGASSRDSSDR